MTNVAEPVPTPPEPNVVLATFLARFVADEDAGGARPVSDYQAMFPGFEEVIGREYAGLIADSEPRSSAGSRVGPESVGPYRILRELGRGGQSVVYLAEDPRLQRKVALKVLPATLLASDRARERFRREAELAAKLDHPGICVVLEHGEHDGMPYIAMRFVEGESLAEHIATAQAQSSESEELTYLEIPEPGDVDAGSQPTAPGGPAPDRREVTRIVTLLERAARALHSAHEAGLLHRDVKPGNIMVTPHGDPVILDFGLARDEFRDGKTITMSGDLMGTPAYMSPEQLLAQRIRLDRRSDVYSLGVTAYECLTLTRPFDAPTREGMYQRILTGEIPDPRRLNPAISRDLKVILETAIEKDRERRYPSALAMAEDLHRLRTFEPISACPAGPWLKLRRWGRRHPALATAIVLAFVSCVSGLLITWHFMQDAEGRADELKVAVDSERRAKTELEGALEDRGRALRRSEALWLVELARQERDVDPQRSASLASGAAERSPGPLTRGALASALEALPHRGSVLGEGAPYAVFTPDGLHLLTKARKEFRRYVVASGHRAATGTVDGLNHRYIATDAAGARLALLAEHRLQVFDTKSGDVIAVLNSEDLTLNRAAFSPDGSLLAVVGGITSADVSKGRVWLLDLESGEQRVLHDTDADCWSLDFDRSGGRIAIACRLGETKVLDVDGKALHTVRATSTLPWPTVVFAPDGKRIFALTRNGFREHTLATAKSRVIPMDDSRKRSMNGVSYGRSADGRLMIVWSEAKGSLAARMTSAEPAVLWDLVKGEPIRVFPGAASSAAISADGKRVAILADDHLNVYDTAVDRADPSSELGRFHDVDWVSLDAAGRRVAVIADDKAEVFDTAEPRAVPRLAAPVYDFAMTADAATLVTYDKKRGTAFLDAKSLDVQRVIPVVKAPQGMISSSGSRHFDMNADGTRAVGKTSVTELAWFDLENGETLRMFDGDGVETCLLTGRGTTMMRSHGKLPKKVIDALLIDLLKSAFLGKNDIDPNLFKALVEQSAVELVDLKTGKTIAVSEWSSFGQPVRSRDGMKILVPREVDRRRGADVIDGKTGKVLFTITTPTVSGEFSPDGARVLAMSSRKVGGWSSSFGEHAQILIDATTGAELATLDTDGVVANDAAWSYDGGQILLSCEDGSVRLHDGRTGALIRKFEGHQGSALGATFSSDASSMVSHGEDGTLRVWSLATGEETLRINARSTPGERGRWRSVRFVAEDAAILAFDTSWRPLVFPVDPVARARAVGVEPVSSGELKRLGL